VKDWGIPPDHPRVRRVRQLKLRAGLLVLLVPFGACCSSRVRTSPTCLLARGGFAPAGEVRSGRRGRESIADPAQNLLADEVGRACRARKRARDPRRLMGRRRNQRRAAPKRLPVLTSASPRPLLFERSPSFVTVTQRRRVGMPRRGTERRPMVKHAAEAEAPPKSGGSRRGAQRAGRRELALATVLLIGAGLLGKSLIRTPRVRLGFSRTSDTFQLALRPQVYPGAKGSAFYRELPTRCGRCPAHSRRGDSSGVPAWRGQNDTTTPIGALANQYFPTHRRNRLADR